MSVAGLGSSSLFDPAQFKSEFQQLGTDLQAGNLSAAQSDFASLQQQAPQVSASSSSQTLSPLSQAFNQLAQDLQSGSISAAQQDYSTIQQDLQNLQTFHGHGHHHHSEGENSGSSQQNPISQLFTELGQALQSGNLTAAQQAYTTVQQDFERFSSAGSGAQSVATPSASPSSTAVNTTA